MRRIAQLILICLIPLPSFSAHDFKIYHIGILVYSHYHNDHYCAIANLINFDHWISGDKQEAWVNDTNQAHLDLFPEGERKWVY